MTGPAERHTSSNFCYVLALIQVTSFHVGATRDLLQNTILIASGSFYHQFRTGGERKKRRKWNEVATGEELQLRQVDLKFFLEWEIFLDTLEYFLK